LGKLQLILFVSLLFVCVRVLCVELFGGREMLVVVFTKKKYEGERKGGKEGGRDVKDRDC